MKPNENDVRIKKDLFIKETKGDATTYYEVMKKIGEGTFGKVYQVKHKITGDIRAMKEIKKSKIKKPEQFKNETKILSFLDHPNIIRLFEIIENDQYYYVIMELCTGGDLLTRMKGSHYKEKDAAVLFHQIISAVTYCHEKGICHRDLKPANILFANSDENAPLKIIDFGLGVMQHEANNDKVNNNCDYQHQSDKIDFKRMNSIVGTIYYLSPEVLKGNYNEKCDIWSCGVILYYLLSGYLPFNGTTDKEVYKNIFNYKFDLEEKPWKNISRNAKELLKNIFVPEKKRFSSKEILYGKWLETRLPKKDSYIPFNFNKIKQYKNYSKFKQAVLFFIATRLSNEETSDLAKLFMKINESQNGLICYDEFKYFYIEQRNLDIFGGLEIEEDEEEEIKEYFDGLDINHNNEVEYTEFLAAILDKRVYLNKERLEEAFKAFDIRNIGLLNNEDIIKSLKMEYMENASSIASSFIEKIDYKKDGKIDFDEFCGMMKN